MKGSYSLRADVFTNFAGQESREIRFTTSEQGVGQFHNSAQNLGIVTQMKFSLDNDYHYDTIPSNFAVKGSREIRYVSNIEGQGSSVTPLKNCKDGSFSFLPLSFPFLFFSFFSFILSSLLLSYILFLSCLHFYFNISSIRTGIYTLALKYVQMCTFFL